MDVLTSLLSHLDTIGWKPSTFGLTKLSGIPRYVKGKDPIEHPKVLAKCCNFPGRG